MYALSLLKQTILRDVTAQGQNLHKQVTSCNDIQIDSCKTIGRVIKIIIVMIQGAPPPQKKKKKKMGGKTGQPM